MCAWRTACSPSLDDDEIATVQDLSAAGTDKLRLAADACPTRAITIAEGADDARAYAKTRPRTASPAQLEMGGHNPLIAMSDADINRAVTAAYAGAFMATGQKCTGTRRIFVRIYGEFRERLLARMWQAVIGDPADPRTGVGPLVNERQYNAVLDAIEQARRDGASLLAGGDRRDRQGYFVAPTLFEDVHDQALWHATRRSAPLPRCFASRHSTRRWHAQTPLSTGSPQRSSPATSEPPGGSPTKHKPGSSTSTPQPPAPRSTSHSAASRRPVGAHTNRDERRSSSTRSQ
jgi:hypothetical protein